MGSEEDMYRNILNSSSQNSHTWEETKTSITVQWKKEIESKQAIFRKLGEHQIGKVPQSLHVGTSCSKAEYKDKENTLKEARGRSNLNVH